MGTDFYFQGNTAFKLTFDAVRGEGRIAPRLVLSFSGRPTKEQTHVILDRVTAEVWLDSEMIGSGGMRDVAAHLYHYGGNLQVVVPISRDVVRHVDENLRSDQLSLRIDLRAAARWRVERDGDVGEWTEDAAFSQATVMVSRSDWVTNVVAPVGVEQFVLMELPVPPPPDRNRWVRSLQHVAEAERSSSAATRRSRRWREPRRMSSPWRRTPTSGLASTSRSRRPRCSCTAAATSAGRAASPLTTAMRHSRSPRPRSG